MVINLSVLLSLIFGLLPVSVTPEQLSSKPWSEYSAHEQETWRAWFQAQVWQESRRGSKDKPSIDLTGAVIQGVNLSGLNLSGAVFFKTDLSDCDFESCDLRNATFRKANLCGVSFSKAQFTNAKFTDLEMRELSLAESDFTGAKFQRVRFDHCIFGPEAQFSLSFSNCVFDEMLFCSRLGDVVVSNSRFLNCKFEGSLIENSTLRGLTLDHVVFYSSAFKNILFDESRVKDSEFTGNSAEDSTFTGVRFTSTKFDLNTVKQSKIECEFVDCNLSTNSFASVNFGHSDLGNSKVNHVKFDVNCDLGGAKFTAVDWEESTGYPPVGRTYRFLTRRQAAQIYDRGGILNAQDKRRVIGYKLLFWSLGGILTLVTLILIFRRSGRNWRTSIRVEKKDN